MKNDKIDNILYIKAGNCFEHLDLANRAFRQYLEETGSGSAPAYYKARNYLRDAVRFYEEAFREAKRLLGPLPAYSSSEFEKWRSDFLGQYNILVNSEELDAVKAELLQNGQLSRWISPEDIERMLAQTYESQRSGKRQLANIKVRIMLDALRERLVTARELQKQAMEKFQSGG